MLPILGVFLVVVLYEQPTLGGGHTKCEFSSNRRSSTNDLCDTHTLETEDVEGCIEDQSSDQIQRWRLDESQQPAVGGRLKRNSGQWLGRAYLYQRIN